MVLSRLFHILIVDGKNECKCVLMMMGLNNYTSCGKYEWQLESDIQIINYSATL